MDLNSLDRRTAEAPPGGWSTPRSAYLHVPFCRHRCGYCNFSVVADRDDWIERYLVAIDRELADLMHPEVDTIFIGGGTPTHLSGDQLQRLFDIIVSRLDLADDAEWTIEANPEDITADKLALLVDHGVNRISLGVQSFDDGKLRLLERGHRGGDARRIIELAAASIENVSIDLIFSVPGESIDGWRKDLDMALALPIRHVSTYALTFEKGTMFWSRRRRGELRSNDESLEVDMYQLAREQIPKAGLAQYEVSNFASPGFRCRHNLSYWRGDGWFAAGPGAARFVQGRREVNHRSTANYLRRMETGRSPTAESESISLNQFARERAAFAVRMVDGIELDEFHRATGIQLRELCQPAIALSVEQGLLQDDGDRLSLTDRGLLFADTVASRFLD